ncbi:MAG: four helix bundle protein [Paludibacter sp.]|nr:four helix bundle protein [Paludibacter sp.]
MRNDKNNLIVNLTVEFALEVIEYCELLESKRKFVLANQLLNSGTSIGANVHEAQNAESKADFIHKIKIAAKEADETDYWLTLCNLASSYPNPVGMDIKITSIINVLSKIISSSKNNPS